LPSLSLPECKREREREREGMCRICCPGERKRERNMGERERDSPCLLPRVRGLLRERERESRVPCLRREREREGRGLIRWEG
jgi:hypothetical protein